MTKVYTNLLLERRAADIQRQVHALAFDIDAHHALIGRTDLQIGGDVAFAVDTHDLSFSFVLARLQICGKSGLASPRGWR